MGKQTHHTKAGLPVCCEQALKSAGEQNTHGGGSVRGPLRETACTGESGEALCGIDGGDLAAGGLSRPAGKLLTGNIGSLCVALRFASSSH
jgi:hypothetical protein